MKKTDISKIDKNKKYKLVINGKKYNTKALKGINIIQHLKRYYNMADMICDSQDFPGKLKIKNEKDFFEYLQNRRSPGCDSIELFEQTVID